MRRRHDRGGCLDNVFLSPFVVEPTTGRSIGNRNPEERRGLQGTSLVPLLNSPLESYTEISGVGGNEIPIPASMT